MAASQTADVEDRAGGRHETDDDADGTEAGAGRRVRGGHGADRGGADGTGTTLVPVPLRAQTCATGGIPLARIMGWGCHKICPLPLVV